MDTTTEVKEELKKDVLNTFWNIYEIEGALQALSWLDTLKYYEEYCHDDISCITERLSKTFI